MNYNKPLYFNKKITLYQKCINFLFLLYPIVLIIPSILYTLVPELFNYFFYGRFIFYVIIGGLILLIFKPTPMKLNNNFIILWLFISILYIIRNLVAKSTRGILFGLSIFWHIFTFINFFNDRNGIDIARRGIIASSIILVILSLIVTLINPDFQIYFEFERYKIMKSGGLLFNAQQLAPYTIIIFTYLLYKLLFDKKCYLKRIIYIIFLTIAVIMIFLTGSRTAITGMFISVIFILFFYFKRKLLIFSGLMLLVALIMFAKEIDFMKNIFNYFLNFYNIYFLRGNPENLYTFGYRLYIWEYAFLKVIESPFWGHGHRMITEYKEYEIFMPHNGYLMVALDVGILGLFALMIILISSVLTAIKKIRNGENDVKLPFIFLLLGLYLNLWESWILSFGYAPCWVLWLSILEILLKKTKIRNV